MPQMKLNPDKLKGMTPLPGDQIYDLKFLGFKPKKTKSGNGICFNAEFEVVGNPNYTNRRVFAPLFDGNAWIIQDFVHGLGLPLEKVGNDISIPGSFNGPEDKPEEWKYTGPLVGRTCKAMLAVTSYNGKERNEIKQYVCAVPDCPTKFPEIRHSTNLIRN